MSRPLTLHPDRLFASDPVQRDIARALYATIADAPIVSPHGHTDPRWFADNQPWSDATTLLLQPDHYIFRMLYSQGVPLDTLAIRRRDGEPATDHREAWRTFAEGYHLFRGTPTRLWLDHVFAEVFGFEEVLDGSTADRYFDRVGDALASDTYRPRALFDRFGIDFLATTEGAHDDLDAHHRIHASGWKGRVVTTYHPDSVIDVEHEQFAGAMQRFGELTGEDVFQWQGYLPRTAAVARTSVPPVRRQPIMGTRRSPPPISRRRRRKRCSHGSSAAPGRRQTPNCSARRC